MQELRGLEKLQGLQEMLNIGSGSGHQSDNSHGASGVHNEQHDDNW